MQYYTTLLFFISCDQISAVISKLHLSLTLFRLLSKQDCLLQGQAQLDQRVVFRLVTLRLWGGECHLVCLIIVSSLAQICLGPG